MRNYLLGTLDGDRRTQLEEKILFDSAIYEDLLVVEQELIEQYLSGDLPAPDKQQFETHFLITAERQKNLRFGQLLNQYVTSQTGAVDQARKTAPANNSPAGPLRFGSPALVFSAAILALLATLCWLARKKPIQPAVQATVTQIVVVTLAPGSIESQSTTTRINAPLRGNVTLELELSNPSFGNYKSELFRENKSLITKGQLKMEAKGKQNFVPLTITGDMLSPGDYQVRLSGVSDSGADEFVDNYSFRVIE